MKKLLLASLLLLVFACGKAQTKEKEETIQVENKTTYYFIRHSEKNRAVKTKNPNLLEKGQSRAENWAEYFKSIAFDAVYSTNYKRTKQTATPTAKQNNLKLIIYNPSKLDYNAFKAGTKGKTVLIVGHSDTTPKFVNTIIGENKYNAINDSINSALFIVTINGNETTSEVLNIEHQ
ncbi:histidine phosphatase family protein [Bizionia saleffrena]|uniref:Histidine phosphatase family protein n=1 Tax=Bizionia saleffrena TaxID=291189 RepID=A0A8H2LNS7_9FLAO|nr:phosphoglycerate mutase family protein [Bizionia saleffrena]TYB77347.1 histidine phosphatase family protein [Bizionia saleffrena]